MANISNDRNNTIVSGTNSADSIVNTGNKVTINALYENDTIDNQGATVSIDGGNGDDYIINTGSFVTITGVNGADSIYSDGSNVLIRSDSGNDYVAIDGNASSVTVFGGDGNDSIENYANNVTINGGLGNDYVNSYGDNVSINGLKGNNIIDINASTKVTINVKDGNDTILVGGSNTTFLVQNFSANDKIQFNYPISSLKSASNEVVADDVTITGVTLSNSTSKWSLKNDVATYSETHPAGVTLTDENAIVYRAAKSSNLFTIGNIATTNGLAVDTRFESVTVSSAALNKKNVTISGDYTLELADDVTRTEIKDIWSKSSATYSYKTNSTIEGYELEDNKIIYSPNTDGETMVRISGLKSEPELKDGGITLSANNFSGNASVVSNAGNYEFELAVDDYSNKTFSGSTSADTIRNYGSNISIAGGAGNDYLHNESNTTEVKMSGGTGNDTLENDSENATLNGGAGNDFIDNLSDKVSISGGAGNDFISNSGSNLTITGDAGNDSISNKGDKVSISGGAGNDSIKNDGDNVTILGGADNDTVENSGVKVLFKYAGGNDVIEGFNSTSTLQLTTGTITSAYSDGADAFLTVGQNVVTLKDLSYLTNVINVMDSVGNTSTYTINLIRGTAAADNLTNSNSNLRIQALGGNDTVNNSASKVTIDGGADKDLIFNSGSNVSILGNAGSDSLRNTASKVTLNGGADNDSISNSASQVSISGGAGNDSIDLNTGTGVTVNVSDGNDTIFVSNSVTSFNVEKFNSGDKIQFNATVSGLSSVEKGITTDKVTITGLTASTTTPSWSFADNSATYSEKYSAGVILSKDNKAIVHRKASTTNLFTVTGVTSTDGLSLDGTTVTVSKSALNKKTVSITDGYSLALGSDVEEWTETPESWQIKDTVATYKDVATVAGYELVDNKINYVKSVDGATLLEIRGMSSEPVLSGNSIMLSPEDFASDISVVSNAIGYEFTLNEGDYSGKTFSGSSAGDYIYNSGGSNIIINGRAGNDSIVNNYGGENVTINAGDGNDSIENYADNAMITTGDGNDTIYNNRDNVTINPGAGNDTLEIYDVKTLIQYSSGDGNDVINGYNGANISIDLVRGTLAGFSSTEENDLVLQIGRNSITFQDTSDELVSLGTSTNDNYVWNGNDNITIDAGEGNNAIDNKASFVTVNSGSGNDTVTLSAEEAGNTFAYTAGSGKDVVYNFGNTDVIKIADDSKFKVNVNKNDIVFKVGKGSVTLKEAAANNTMITITDSQDEVISSDTYTTAGIVKEDSLIELWEKFSGTYTATENISTVDGSNVTGKVRIVANEGFYSELIGGKRSDTLEGSYSDDTLTGGKGSDVFVYNGGSDIITDYAKQDKISVGGESLAVEDFAIDEDDLILSFGNSDSLTIVGGAGKAITFIENKKNITRFYEPDGVFDKKKKSVVLNGAETTFNAANYSKLVTIDASPVMDYMEINGNSKANMIIASQFGGTLNGGKGKDTLVGRENITDVFVYENRGGKDIIEGYDSGDIISLGSGVTFKDSKFKKDNAVIKFKSGSITVNDAKNIEVTLTSATENDTIYSNGVFIDQANSVAKVYGSYKGAINLDEYYATTADASEAKKKISIQGSAGDDTLLGGKNKDTLVGGSGDDSLFGGKGKDNLYGGEGNDTLWGGKGNDSLWGGDGDDTFIFHAGDGNDTIMDYAEGDLLKVLDKNGKKEASFTAVFDDDKLTIKVKGGGNFILSGVESSTEVNINDTTKTVRAWAK